MSSSPPAASLSLTGSRLKAQLDASRRPPHIHHVRRVVSSNITPRKKKEPQRERPKTVAETRSGPPRERSPCRRTPVEHSPSPEKCTAPTPPPSRSNSTTSSVPGGRRTSPAKAPGEGQQLSSRSSPKRRTPSKLKLRDRLSPVKVSSRSQRACASPPKRTPPKLKLKRSTPTTDLASLGRSPSPNSPAKSSTTAGNEEGNTPCPNTRKTRKA